MLKENSETFSERQIAIEYFCTKCNNRDYKQISEQDKMIFDKVKSEFVESQEHLLYPKELLPITGSNIKNLLNYGFKTFSDLFNARQLLSLSLILNYINEMENQILKEFMLAAFSSCLEFHTVLCPYNYTMKQIVNVFNYQSFLVPLQYVENNVWGTKKGNGTFLTYLAKMKKAKSYCNAPFEIIINGGKISRVFIEGDRIQAELVNSFEGLKNRNSPDVLLIAGSSVNLKKYDIPDQSIDLVLTDPPYFDYIQYTELANFFFVWLKLVLKNTYSWFTPQVITSECEVGFQKIETEFLSLLTSVFNECYRVLKIESPLIFTFHHSNYKAWSLILTAIKKSNFELTSAFPVYSEFKARPASGGNHDLVLVCRKDKSLMGKNLITQHQQLKGQIEKYIKQFTSQEHETEGGWESFFAEILPILSFEYKRESEKELNKILKRIFTLKNIR
jgi:adenine-specific DNA methylase